MMRTRLIRAMGTSLVAGSMAFSLSAHAAQGLYSADDLMDADVYDSSGEEIGEVANILMDDNMSVHSLVIKTGDVLGMGGRDVVAERGTFTLRLEEEGDNEFDDQDYEVHMEATQDEIKALPEYDESWWNQTSDSLSQAWENTKESSRSAWEDTKQATSSAWQNLKQGVESMSDDAEN
ncbi:PRC-barrel domain containing protein [Marinobacter panjinensis]|uniref:PRC-barrel domain containing protein n=1 Tax=Marinobacter panjinensis TaxID=2576384 RepID=A0A4U6QUI8_9GAMM|nr:PRC-barrel domain-containing protein [Marinobacter panjinensis]MCR8915143.1 PRC-barrel domain-containing protein [Marinobacter panjinensis]TKV64369.1 PRC-barrel domain containing protein [Marinobacter panjinensis]